MTGAARRVTQFGFRKLGLRRIEAVAAVDNWASRRVAEKTEVQFERILSDLNRRHLHAPVAEDVLGAIGQQQRYNTSFWDATILWSAQQLGCSKIWSEDLSEGQDTTMESRWSPPSGSN